MNIQGYAADLQSKIDVVVSDGNVFKATAPGLTCINTNPNQTTASSSSSIATAAATASNLSSAEVGTYKNADNCQLVIGNNGTFRLTLPASTALTSTKTWVGGAWVASNASAVDVTTVMGGDHSDNMSPVWVTYANGIGGMSNFAASDYKLLGGNTISISVFQSSNIAGMGSPFTTSVGYRDSMPTSVSSGADCTNMVKQ